MTVKKYLTWVSPDTNEEYTHTEVWKSTNQGVSWNEFTASNDPDYTTDGILIATPYAVDLVGATGHWYKIRHYDNVNSVYSDWSDVMTGSETRGYCSVDDVRSFTNVQTGEYSDAAIQTMIDMITKSTDTFTNRTWQGTITETDRYYDGNDSNFIILDENDLGSVSSLAIDEDGEGTYTAISSAYIHLYTDRAGVLLDDDAEVTKFPNRRRSVKITYTYGNSSPTEDVRHLAILLVANMMKMDSTRTAMIAELKAGLIVGTYENTPTGVCPDSAY